MKKIKYITNKLFKIFLISIVSIIIYQIFIDIKQENVNINGLGSKIVADEINNNNEQKQGVSEIIEKVSNNVVGISKIKNIGSSAFLMRKF